MEAQDVKSTSSVLRLLLLYSTLYTGTRQFGKKCTSGLSIEIVDLNKPDSQVPESIIAVPAYRLNGSTVFMGTPTLQALIERLDAD